MAVNELKTNHSPLPEKVAQEEEGLALLPSKQAGLQMPQRDTLASLISQLESNPSVQQRREILIRVRDILQAISTSSSVSAPEFTLSMIRQLVQHHKISLDGVRLIAQASKLENQSIEATKALAQAAEQLQQVLRERMKESLQAVDASMVLKQVFLQMGLSEETILALEEEMKKLEQERRESERRQRELHDKRLALQKEKPLEQTIRTGTSSGTKDKATATSSLTLSPKANLLPDAPQMKRGTTLPKGKREEVQ